MPKIDELLETISAQLSKRHNHAIERTQDAWWMLEAITGKSEARLLAQREVLLTSEQQETLDRWLDLHVNKYEPLQYLIGSTPFNDVEILCEPPILIPRPETEEWVINLIELLNPLTKQVAPAQPFKILDLCAGSGCIAIALAKAFPMFQIVATDINPQAIDLIKKNIEQNKIHNVTIYKADLFDGIPKTELFDLIVSNPPYISEKDWQGLDPSVKNWEDKAALTGGPDGLAIIKRIIEEAKFWLRGIEEVPSVMKPPFIVKDTISDHVTERSLRIPKLVVEMDYYQGHTIQVWLELHGYINISIKKDLEGKDRVICASRI